ncbi:MAG: hybrid sensor histidine kinase/response regulator, partial [Candidatus Latescibacteria bacterium]|nr:hybrid sensor histidine kinase/response regulator [Candidatus Latescibacterota bacterium]
MTSDRANTVLIVDDNEPNRIVLNDYLQTLGYRTVSSENGQEALDLAAKCPPDAILLDILMPVMDGFECLDRLKADEKTHNIPVIVISALDEMDSVVRCLEMGATDFLTKPFNSVLLRARLSASLQEKESLERERQLHGHLEKSYEELQQTERTRDALAHMIVHDLNNPLTAIMGRAQLFLMACNDGERDWDDAIKNHRVILSAAEEMATLIRSILDVSKMEGDQIEVQIEKIDIGQTATQVCEQMQLQASQLGVDLSLKNSTDGCSVLADRTLLHRVLQNLLANSFK